MEGVRVGGSWDGGEGRGLDELVEEEEEEEEEEEGGGAWYWSWCLCVFIRW